MAGRGLVLSASAAVLVLAGAGLAVDWLATQRDRTVVYRPPDQVRSIDLEIASGSVDVVGGRGEAIRVQRTDRFAFDHPALERRSLAGGVLRLSSRCPRIIVGSCSASYRLVVPDDVSVAVRTGAGHIHFDDFRGSARIQSGSGPVAVDAFCGFGLTAASVSGSVRVVSACAPEKLDLRSGTGDATAIVPPGRYRVAAQSTTGQRHVRGIVPSAQAAYSIAVQSRTGNVTVAGGL
ncbi:MAG: hypothetical protein QOE27_1888 [Solirubrobacteraceae bacterium]|nr:hypothetical protein [Solirubrobacteraceae bacterium]